MKTHTRRRIHQARFVIWGLQVPIFGWLVMYGSTRALVIYLGLISVATGLEGPVTSLEANTPNEEE